MPQYKVNALSFINGSLVPEGSVIEFDDKTGKPGPHMEEIKKPSAKGKESPAKDADPLI